MFRSITPYTTDDFWPLGEATPDARQTKGRRNLWRELVMRIRAGVAAIAEWRRLRRATCELESMNSRMLKDIGISRSEIGWVVRYGRTVENQALGKAGRVDIEL